MIKKGFTLSEVFITISIIGVVAALTLPSLINKIQDKHFKSVYKKDVALMSEAMKMLYANDDKSFDTSFAGLPKSVCALRKYLKISHITFECAEIEAYEDDPTKLFDNWIKNYRKMWHSNDSGSLWFTKDNIKMPNVMTYEYSTIHLTNGAMVFFPCCNRIYIDVNGYKKPNVIGKDIFALPIENGLPQTKIGNSFVPQGCFGEKNTSTTLTKDNYVDDCLNGHGWGCSFLYLEE